MGKSWNGKDTSDKGAKKQKEKERRGERTKRQMKFERPTNSSAPKKDDSKEYTY